MTAKPVLYSFYRSSASWRVRIALALKKVDYETQPVKIIKGSQFRPEYLRVNPLAQVPCLVIDGMTLTQSLPIIEYLDETRPGQRIMPPDPVLRFRTRQIAEVINCGVQPLQNLSLLKKLMDVSGDKGLVLDHQKDAIKRGFKTIEQILQETAGDFCVGDAVSLADLTLVPQMLNAKRIDITMSRYPTVQRVYENLVMLEAFQQADPQNQPDFDGEDWRKYWAK